MQRSVLPVVLALGVSLLLGACESSSDASPTLTKADDGGTVELRVGDTLEIVLEGNPTTGYRWETASVEQEILAPAGEPEFVADSEAMGAGGRFVLRFQGVTTGRAHLRLAYRRPWESADPIDTFEVTVAVQ